MVREMFWRVARGLFCGALLCVFLLSGRAQAQEPDAPEQVIVGAHINDIQAIDLQQHNYRMDIYVWFRWKNPALAPYKTAEFMNAYDPADHVRTELLEAPQKMPDGSLYMIVRDQGKFSVKFPLQDYPFDRQNLSVVMEDSLHEADELVYVADDKTPIGLSKGITLPGFNIGTPSLGISVFPYDTTFGDVSEKRASSYARASFNIPVIRPHVSSGIKIFLPVILVIICTALVLFVHPAYIEGRLGVAITALLTLVALQLTTASGLPDVDYLLTVDKVYLLSYLFIIATLMQVVRLSGLVHDGSHDAVRASDRRMLAAVSAVFVLAVLWVVL